jgi:HD-like signal output (HDOD) protein
MKQSTHRDPGPALSFPVANRANANARPSVAAHNSSGQGGLAALEFLQALTTELGKGTVDLPCFPNVVLKIREALSDPETTADTVARMIGAEPRLSARLLQMANAAAVNPSGKRVTDLKTAITRLGQQLVQGAAMAFAVQQMKDAPTLASVSQALTDLWKRSITVASICQVVARRTSVSADAAFLTGLLHGIGQLYIVVRSVGYGMGAADQGTLGELIEGWHPNIGQLVLENWEMDEAISQAVHDQQATSRPKHVQPDLTDVLIVSLMLSDILLSGAKGGDELEQSPPFQVIGLKAEDCGLIMTHASYQLESLLEALGC